MTGAPPRGTRSRNRRDQIRTAALTLFYERGYEQVSVADVAGSVNVGPSALYRHFTGKADLLFHALDTIITSFAGTAAELPAPDLDGIARTAARTALQHRALGVLWQRESRNLDAPHRQELARRLKDALDTLADTLRGLRPELDPAEADFLAAAVVNAMSSISFHEVVLPDPDFEDVLAGIARRIARHRFLAPGVPPARRSARPESAGRLDQLVAAAAELFAQRGFDAVGIDDIGAAVGIAGPSIYHHFDSKHDLLVAVISRGQALLDEIVEQAAGGTGSSTTRLRRLSDAYVALACDQGPFVSALLTETRDLDDTHRDTAHAAQRRHLGHWLSLAAGAHPADETAVSRVRVHAAQLLALSMGRSHHLQARPDFRRDLTELCASVVVEPAAPTG